MGVVYFCGWPGFLYLAFSFFFSIGLHPVGARWIQEHYTNDPEQETYSYYGPINRLALNMGYHNEHHDLQPKVSLLLEPTSVRVHLRQKVQPVFSNRENEAAQRRSAILSAYAPASDSGCPERGDNYLLMYDAALRLK